MTSRAGTQTTVWQWQSSEGGWWSMFGGEYFEAHEAAIYSDLRGVVKGIRLATCCHRCGKIIDDIIGGVCQCGGGA